jgi:hypothetical protein
MACNGTWECRTTSQSQMGALRSMRLHSLVLGGLALLFGRVWMAVRNMPYKVERACSSCGRSGFIAASLIDGGFECYRLVSPVIPCKKWES